MEPAATADATGTATDTKRNHCTCTSTTTVAAPAPLGTRPHRDDHTRTVAAFHARAQTITEGAFDALAPATALRDAASSLITIDAIAAALHTAAKRLGDPTLGHGHPPGAVALKQAVRDRTLARHAAEVLAERFTAPEGAVHTLVQPCMDPRAVASVADSVLTELERRTYQVLATLHAGRAATSRDAATLRRRVAALFDQQRASLRRARSRTSGSVSVATDGLEPPSFSSVVSGTAFAPPRPSSEPSAPLMRDCEVALRVALGVLGGCGADIAAAMDAHPTMHRAYERVAGLKGRGYVTRVASALQATVRESHHDTAEVSLLAVVRAVPLAAARRALAVASHLLLKDLPRVAVDFVARELGVTDVDSALRAPRESGGLRDREHGRRGGGASANPGAASAAAKPRDDECTICMASARSLLLSAALPCGHAFCLRCVERWVGECSAGGREPTCMMCRAAFSHYFLSGEGW